MNELNYLGGFILLISLAYSSSIFMYLQFRESEQICRGNKLIWSEWYLMMRDLKKKF
jgi:hypothetical protein